MTRSPLGRAVAAGTRPRSRQTETTEAFPSAAGGSIDASHRWPKLPDGYADSHWAIRTTAAWMKLLAPLPFVAAIFRLNHHSVMRAGLGGIRTRLGGVAGTYTREE